MIMVALGCSERDDILALIHAYNLSISRVYEAGRAAGAIGDFDEMDRRLVEAESIRKKVLEMSERLREHREKHGC